LPIYVLKGPDPYVDFSLPDGPPIKSTLTQAQNQMLQWIGSNCPAPQQPTVLREANKLIKEAAPKKGNFSLTLDGQLTTSHKTTELCVCLDELLVLEFTDAQAKDSGLTSGTTRGVVWGEHFETGENAVKIESITLENEDTMDLTKFVKGKIVLRAITQGGIGSQMLFMVCGDKDIQYPLQANLDNSTIDFSLSIYGRNKNDETPAKHFGNQMVVSFFTATTAARRDSNVVSKLIKIAP
jgi:hypothetical protein